ncbi:MAG: hypothetical protein VYC11_00260 [Candidatus Thermoplasmatota archaeon]|jgi:hypothetical protein|nr:hypothetical protein [Euryarchaeota archaeon]MEC7704139.1 hypothetical protein [Candidatus Thermoplasmatota archaeon]MEC9089781.1 hypothetical protein [Candidatus Thermoplasmatota archaeon]|tara:strand:+ start:130 stop:717 length:588 start_codon:yes stop_codon:yes gene_type:complete
MHSQKHNGEAINNEQNYHPTGGTVAIGNPADTLTYVRAIGLIVGGYSAYQRDKRRETDVAVKEEILRCADRVRTHVENVHDDAYRDGDVKLAKTCQSTIEEIDALRNDVNLGETGGEHPFFSKQTSASKKILGKLIKHDHDTLTMLVKAVNRSNDLEKAAAEGGDVIKALRETRQLVSSVRGHFSERRSVLKNIQ